MARTFDIPSFYRSPIIGAVKRIRQGADQRKADLQPTELELGPVRFRIARHFGFCFGVENAIEIAYRALSENPDKRVFLLSEMIHNTHVNSDLLARGVRFLMSTSGEQLIPFTELQPTDIVIVPAFGTSRELFAKLAERGIDPYQYNATCPFVEKVWKRAEMLGKQGFAVVIHGKHSHEETRATFSHAQTSAPTVVVRDREETELLCRYIRGEIAVDRFSKDFAGKFSAQFNPSLHLKRLGVVNQTTMLATETQEIAQTIRTAMSTRYGLERLSEHFADTRDTLCYATSQNQDAVTALVEAGGDIALVVGGYNSSNTSHLVEICEQHVPTFYIKDAEEILSRDSIRHFSLHDHAVIESTGWLSKGEPTRTILVTAGASCPDALVEAVVRRVALLLGVEDRLTQALDSVRARYENSSISGNA